MLCFMVKSKAMEYFILSLWLAFLAVVSACLIVVVSVCLMHTKSPQPNNNMSYLGDADEKAIMSQAKSVPGKSPATYTGDPSKDILQIERLDLVFGPPEHPCVPRYVWPYILPKTQDFQPWDYCVTDNLSLVYSPWTSMAKS